ncbi:hypothetical protein Tco_0551425 [Tanacetum coccineum]
MGSEVRKIEQESAKKVFCCMSLHAFLYCDDEDDYIPLGDIIARYSTSKSITPDLPIEEPTILSKNSGVWRDIFDIDPIFKEFADELTHIATIPPGIVEADFDPNDDTSSDDDDFEDIKYVSLEEVNEVDQENEEFDLDDILQIQTLPSVKIANGRIISKLTSKRPSKTSSTDREGKSAQNPEAKPRKVKP